MSLQKYVTEFIGTFFLVGIIGFAVTTDAAGHGAGGFAPLAIGSGLMAMVFMGGHVSGAHYNPMVSLAVLVRGKMSFADFIPYIISQLLGATVAAAAVYALRGDNPNPNSLNAQCLFAVHPPNSDVVKVLLAEFIFSFALASVVVNVATAPKNANNSFYGLAIGFIVTAGAYSVGNISGAVFNPSVATGPNIIEAMRGGGGAAFKDLWIYWVAPLAGGLAAGLVCNFQVRGHDVLKQQES